MSIATRDIDEFWRWFREISGQLEKKTIDADSVASVDQQVKKLGPLAWEVGPGKTAPNSFTISPNGNIDCLDLTRRVVARAPKLASWEFHSSKQIRELAPILRIRTKGTDKVAEVDPTEWGYVLYKYKDGKVEIVVEAPRLCELPEPDRYAALHVVLDGLLGEETRLTLICGEEVVPALSPDDQERASDMADLPKHLSLLGSTQS